MFKSFLSDGYMVVMIIQQGGLLLFFGGRSSLPLCKLVPTPFLQSIDRAVMHRFSLG
jgi:hypothetical protein